MGSAAFPRVRDFALALAGALALFAAPAAAQPEVDALLGVPQPAARAAAAAAAVSGDVVDRIGMLLEAAPAASVARAAPSAVSAAVTNVAIARTATSRPIVRSRSSRPVVVIDAGHGGRDPGALGAQAREKDLTLAAALALRTRLQRDGRYRVVLTRDRDVYLTLEARLAAARRARADLFISLHADAGPNSTARGATVFTLSDQGVSRAARRALNNQDWFAVEDAPPDATVSRVLLDLTQRATVNASAAFARLLIDEVRRHAVVRTHSHRDAGFYVLLAPDVPAVLLELGFMTNPLDEAALADPARMRRLMGGVGDSIDRYFRRNDQVASR